MIPYEYDIFALPDAVRQYQQANGTQYQWKLLLIHGELQTVHQARMIERGWRPVPLSRHPEIGIEAANDVFRQANLPDNLEPYYKDCIIRGNEILMEWTIEAEARARELDRLVAQSQIVRDFALKGMRLREENNGSMPIVVDHAILNRARNTATYLQRSCFEQFWLKTWWLFWKIGIPARWLLTTVERDIANRTSHTGTWYRNYHTYAHHKAALILEGRL